MEPVAVFPAVVVVLLIMAYLIRYK